MTKQYEAVIGLEVHAEMNTASKIFCGCSTAFGGAPNTHCCPVCMGLPGALPVLNRAVVEKAMLAGLALGCDITRVNVFDRKNYFYPDLPKAYQISQLYLPICTGGGITLKNGRTVTLREIHMEEDAGKLIHDPWTESTLCDYNRCGVPLMEIVTQPDLRSADEVVEFLQTLKLRLEFAGVTDGKMQEGSLRADLNVSVREAGAAEYGTRTEMKNMNSFKAIHKAVLTETQRQIALMEKGGKVVQETRRWDDNKDASFPMRSKENAQDYRYFPDPDLPPVVIDDKWLQQITAAMPELPEQKRARYQSEYALPERDILILCQSARLAKLFEDTVECGVPTREAANWILSDVLRLCREHGMEPADLTLPAPALASVITYLMEETLDRAGARELLAAVFDDPTLDRQSYIQSHDLALTKGDDQSLLAVVDAVLAENTDAVQRFKDGNEKVLGFLVGQCCRRVQGHADAKAIGLLVKAALAK